MDIKNISRDMGNSIEHSYNTISTRIRDFKYQKEALIAFLIVVAGAGIFLTYRWYGLNQNRTAQIELSNLITAYDAALHSKESNFSSLIEQANTGHANTSKSIYAPYFLLFEVDMLLRENKKDEAVATMEKALDQLKGSPIFALFSTKYALMLLDAADIQAQEKGLAQLIKNAQDSSNIYRDYALYYLGRYYLLHNQKADAKIAWQELIESQRIEQTNPSPWAQLAEQHMTHI